MVRRQPNRYDAVINSVNWRLMRDAPSYQHQYVRSALPVQQLTETRGQFASHEDRGILYQTSWADGAFWNKPLLSSQSIASYNVADGIDAAEVPGELVVLPAWSDYTTQDANIALGKAVVQIGEDVYFGTAAGAPVSNGALRKWDASGGSWSTVQSFGRASDVQRVEYDSENDYIIAILADGYFGAVQPDGSGDKTGPDIGTMRHGGNIFLHFGRVMVYDGDIVSEIEDPYGSPSETTIFDDGMGPEWLQGRLSTPSDTIFPARSIRLAVSTSEGIYVVKNTAHGDSVLATIHRIDRSNDGTNIGAPIATLPQGFVALDVQYHLGSLLIVGSTEISKIVENDATAPYGTSIFHLTNGSLGSVGSPRGYDAPDEVVAQFLGNFGGTVYIGGTERIWRYDAIRGGLHPVLEHGKDELIVAAVQTNDAGSHELWFASMEGDIVKLPLSGGTGNDSITRVLDSNYMDFMLPAESKTVTHVTLMTDGMQTNETWTVSVETDDGAYTSVATFTSADNNTTKKRFGSVKTGHRFRYRLAYTASGAVATPSRIKGIVFHALRGEMVQQWSLRLDGTEARNVENVKIRPEDALSALEALGALATPVTYVDEFRETAQTYNVRVDSVSVVRSESGEITEAAVVLTEDA